MYLYIYIYALVNVSLVMQLHGNEGLSLHRMNNTHSCCEIHSHLINFVTCNNEVHVKGDQKIRRHTEFYITQFYVGIFSVAHLVIWNTRFYSLCLL